MRKNIATRTLGALIVVLSVACGARNDVREPPGGEDPLDPGAAGEVVIQVDNQSTRQATIYMIEDGRMPVRIGVVPSFSERFFERRLWGSPSVQFDVRLLAGRTFRTPSVVASAGDTVQVTIPPRF